MQFRGPCRPMASGGGDVARRDAHPGRRDQQVRRQRDGVLLGRPLRPVPGLIVPQAGWMSSAKASARVNAPVIARLEPSPNNDTHDAASPTRPTRPIDQVGTRTRLRESKYRSSAARTRSEQFGHPPACAGVRIAQQPLVLVEVSVVEVRDLGCTEHERRDRLAARWVDGHRPARGVVHDEVGSGLAVQRQGGDVDAEVRDVVGLRAERQRPGTPE